MAIAAPSVPAAEAEDAPRVIYSRPLAADRIFRGVLRGASLAVLFLTGGILVFLAVQAEPAWRAMGLRFLTTGTWSFLPADFGVAVLLPDSVLIAVIALTTAIPVGIVTALFISEYASPGLRRALITVVDLMAAIPSVVIALFALYFLQARMVGTSRWLAHHLGWLPIFAFHDADQPQYYVGSMFIAGVAVSILIIPIMASLCRQVFSQAPPGEREAAYALGATKWGMIRTVVLPYGRGGMIGASLLGLGRALGETIIVSFILTPVFTLTPRILQANGNSITYMIALYVRSAGPLEISALLAAGLVLFLMTLAVNTIAAIIISRSRSGASASAD